MEATEDNSGYTYENAPRVRVYRPTLDQWKNIINYIRHIENICGHKAGIVKIIPPLGWKARIGGYKGNDVLDMIIQTPQEQVIKKVVDDVYAVENYKKNSMSVPSLEILPTANYLKLHVIKLTWIWRINTGSPILKVQYHLFTVLAFPQHSLMKADTVW